MGYPLSVKQYVVLVLGVGILLGWTLVDQVFLTSPVARAVTFSMLGLALMLAYYRVVDPSKVWALSRHLSVLLLTATVALAAVMHLVVAWEPRVLVAQSWQVWLIVAALPFVAGSIHSLYRHRGAAVEQAHPADGGTGVG